MHGEGRGIEWIEIDIEIRIVEGIGIEIGAGRGGTGIEDRPGVHGWIMMGIIDVFVVLSFVALMLSRFLFSFGLYSMHDKPVLFSTIITSPPCLFVHSFNFMWISWRRFFPLCFIWFVDRS